VLLVIHTIGEDFRGTKSNVDEKAPWGIAIDNQEKKRMTIYGGSNYWTVDFRASLIDTKLYGSVSNHRMTATKSKDIQS
jgi:hypothetical protein